MSKERATHYHSIMTGKMPADLKVSHIKEINKISKTMRVLKSGEIWDKKQQNKGLLVAVGIAILIMLFPA